MRVHDLKHTFGRRLRAAGVGFEDRQDLLGHKSQRITTHHSAAEITTLLTVANKVCEGCSGPALIMLKHQFPDVNTTLTSVDRTALTIQVKQIVEGSRKSRASAFA